MSPVKGVLARLQNPVQSAVGRQKEAQTKLYGIQKRDLIFTRATWHFS